MIHLQLGRNPDNSQVPVDESTVVIQPTAPSSLDAPPPYTALYPDNGTPENTTFDSNISRSFQTNAWRDIVINGHQLFKDLSRINHKMLEEAIDTPDATIYAVRVALDVAEDQKCATFYEFLRMFAFVKNYLKFKSENQMKSVLPESDVRQTARYEPAVMSQVDAAPSQSRHPDPMGDPFCCWLWWMSAPPTHGESCPCCLCCLNCCDGAEANVTPNTAASPDCCGGCPDCDCGDCDCGDCDCGDCGGCDCGGF